MDPSLHPLSVFLVKRGGGGDRVLFRFPFNVAAPKRQDDHGQQGADVQQQPEQDQSLNLFQIVSHHHLYKLPRDMLDDDIVCPSEPTANLKADTLPNFPSKVLSNLFAVHPRLCDRKFELKINDVRFVGHPISLELKPGEEKNLARKIPSSITMFHVVFALRASANYSVVEIYHDLSQQIGVAIKYEERRCGYLSGESKSLLNIQEEVAAMPEDSQVSPFAVALDRSQIAQSLKAIFEEITHNGIVYERIHKYIEVSFCMPQKVYCLHNPYLTVEPESIYRCLEALRPYHGMLLLYEERELLDQFPLDASPALKKLIRYSSPMKSFRTLSSDSDIALKHVFHLAGHLLYWGKAIVIYPICESNVYVVSPKIKKVLTPVVMERFNDKFPGENLVSTLSVFSLPTSIAQRSAPILHAAQLQLLTRTIVWLLQQHLLVQLHTYVILTLNKDVRCRLEDPLEKKFGRNKRPMQPKILEAEFGTADGGGDTIISPSSTTSSVLETVEEAPETVPSGGVQQHESAGSSVVAKTQQEVLLSEWTASERAVILKVPAASNLEDLKLFAKVAKYMNGKYHLEEIMYHENVRRAQLLQLVDKFRSILIRHEHEDPAVTMYYEPVLRR